MLIRSQDKRSLLNLDNVTDLSVVSGNEIIAYYVTNEGYQRIGKYSDEAKAIKVLDMIQVAYGKSKILETGQYIVNYSDMTSFIYEMPSDEEVEG